MSRRLPAVAGQFYSASPQGLRADVERYTDPSATHDATLATISPHAGLMYSGHVAGAVYSHVSLPQTVILIGPNHTGVGPVISVYPEGAWLIPGAEIPIDRAVADMIVKGVSQAQADESAHRFEHCLEVQLPFLVHARPDLSIVPIVVGTTDLDVCKSLGHSLAQLVRHRAGMDGRTPPPLLVATTDMSHYEPADVARRKDDLAMDAIRRVDPDSLHATVQEHGITMCGVGPVIAVLEAARVLGISKARLIRYATSGDISGDFDRVVGYAGFLLPRPASPAESSLRN